MPFHSFTNTGWLVWKSAQSVGKRSLKSESRLVLFDRVIELALTGEREPEVLPRQDVVRRDAKRFPIPGSRLVEPTTLCELIPKVRLADEVVVSDCDGMLPERNAIVPHLNLLVSQDDAC